MRYIKEYSEHSQFTTEDIEELKDVYQDIVDDIGLYDNPFQILNVYDSSFHFKSPLYSSTCKIFIRTIVSEMWHFGEYKDITKEQMENHNRVKELLKPHLERITNMGYKVVEKDIIDSFNSQDKVINGIVVEITK